MEDILSKYQRHIICIGGILALFIANFILNPPLVVDPKLQTFFNPNTGQTEQIKVFNPTHELINLIGALAIVIYALSSLVEEVKKQLTLHELWKGVPSFQKSELDLPNLPNSFRKSYYEIMKDGENALLIYGEKPDETIYMSFYIMSDWKQKTTSPLKEFSRGMPIAKENIRRVFNKPKPSDATFMKEAEKAGISKTEAYRMLENKRAEDAKKLEEDRRRELEGMQ